MTVDNLLSADIVTADGRSACSASENEPDLFWALRGGGGNFGIVTRFEFRLHPVGPDVLSGLIVFPFDRGEAVLSSIARFTETMPDELNVWMVRARRRRCRSCPRRSTERRSSRWPCAMRATRPRGEADRAAAQVRQALGEHIGVQPYTAWQQAFDPLLTPGARNYWKSHNSRELKRRAHRHDHRVRRQAAVAAVRDLHRAIGGQTTAWRPTQWRTRTGRQFVMNVHARWESAAEDERCIAWAREFFQEFRAVRQRRRLHQFPHRG